MLLFGLCLCVPYVAFMLSLPDRPDIPQDAMLTMHTRYHAPHLHHHRHLSTSLPTHITTLRNVSSTAGCTARPLDAHLPLIFSTEVFYNGTLLAVAKRTSEADTPHHPLAISFVYTTREKSVSIERAALVPREAFSVVWVEEPKVLTVPNEILVGVLKGYAIERWGGVIGCAVACIVVGLVAGVAQLRQLYRSFNRYNLSYDEDDGSFEDEPSWRNIYADVFRPPHASSLLTLLSAVTSLSIGTPLFLLPTPPWSFLPILLSILVYTFISASATGGLHVTASSLFNPLMLSLLAVIPVAFVLWCIDVKAVVLCVPLFGVYYYVAKGVEGGMGWKTNSIVREVPEQPWWNTLGAAVVWGVIPFGVQRWVLLPAMRNIVEDPSTSSGVALVLAWCAVCTVTFALSFILTYQTLDHENHHWWWRAMFTAAGSSLFHLAWMAKGEGGEEGVWWWWPRAVLLSLLAGMPWVFVGMYSILGGNDEDEHPLYLPPARGFWGIL